MSAIERMEQGIANRKEEFDNGLTTAREYAQGIYNELMLHIDEIEEKHYEASVYYNVQRKDYTHYASQPHACS
jgi:hypothetical protein